MVDNQKTSALRERIKKERIEKEDVTKESNSNTSLITLFSLLSNYAAFYGAQWLILTKLNYQPFSIIESLIILIGLKYFFTKN